MPVASPTLVAWVARHVLPHEPAARAWLRRAGAQPADADELIQEAYARIAALPSVSHIERPGGYLLQLVRNLRRERLRRDRVVRFEALTEIAASSIEDEGPGPDRAVEARLRLDLVERLLAALPDRCRTIFLLRRAEGLSQREIAARLGVSEHVVENDAARGLRLLLAGLRRMEGEDTGERERAGGRFERQR